MDVYVAGKNRPVDTGDSYFGEIARCPIQAASGAKRRLAQRNIIQRIPIEGKPLKSRVEYGRWIVDCPNCGGAEFAFEDRLFVCSLCQDSDIGGKPRRVVMPRNRRRIEELLGRRFILNRHWLSGESIKKLKAENDKEGIK